MNLEAKFKDFIRLAQETLIENDLPLIEGIAVADEKNLLCCHRFTPQTPRNIYSHTKSYMSTAVGLALDSGKLRLDDRLTDYFPESVPENPAADLDKITLRHLLTMSSGFGKSYLMGGERAQGQGYPDYVKFMLSRPMGYAPGERFHYSNGDSYLAGRMAAKAMGRNIAGILYDRFFSKCGIGWPTWEHCPSGHAFGASALCLTLTDMLKLGQLYLADGRWNGEQILSAEWVKAASAKQIETDGGDSCGWNCGYGYQFWMSPYPKAYRADGAYGQITMVLPEKGLVLSVQCPESGNFEKVKRALHEFIPAL